MTNAETEHGAARIAQFLALLGDPDRVPISARDIRVVCAHPDDETIGCGAQLGRMQGVMVVIVTDGALGGRQGVQGFGLGSAEGYAAIRKRELRAALEVIKLPADALLSLDVPDDRAPLRLVEITLRLFQLFARWQTRTVVTHSFEGGHPDHDATAFAVHAASRLLRRRRQHVGIVEMPFYRNGRSGRIRQRFSTDRTGPGLTVALNQNERLTKQRMIAAYATQRDALSKFSIECEQFREAPAYDLTRLPNGGSLLYEQYDRGMTGARWLTLARTALTDLGIDGAG